MGVVWLLNSFLFPFLLLFGGRRHPLVSFQSLIPHPLSFNTFPFSRSTCGSHFFSCRSRADRFTFLASFFISYRNSFPFSRLPPSPVPSAKAVGKVFVLE